MWICHRVLEEFVKIGDGGGHVALVSVDGTQWACGFMQ